MTRSEHTHKKSKIRLHKDGLYMLHITNPKDAWDTGAFYIMSPLTQTTGPCLLQLLLIYEIIH